MKRTFKLFSIAAVSAALLTACQKDNSKAIEGNDTTVELSVGFEPNSTRAANDPNATDAEIKLSTVDVFIFDGATNLLVTPKVRLTMAGGDFDPATAGSGNNDKYVGKKKVNTKTGWKRIYVGVNLPASFPTVSSVADLKAAWDITSVNLVDGTDGIAMFSAAETYKNLVEEGDAGYAANNKFTINVERMVSKVAVQADNALSLTLANGSGVVSGLKWDILQSSKKMFPFQLNDGGVIKDPNWAAYTAGDLTAATAGTYTKSVDLATVTDKKQLAVIYTPENTSKNYTKQELTYASVKCMFEPTFYTDDTGVSKGANAAATDFWTVTLNNGSIYFFDVTTEADDFMLIAAIAAKNPVKSQIYAGKMCYYDLYLNPKNGFNVIRNGFYHATIKNILKVGKPVPGPEEPTLPPTTSTTIDVSVEVVAWSYENDSYDLQ